MDEILDLPQERLKNGWNALHTQSCMIGHPNGVYSATVGDSTAGASIFLRRRGRARRGALRQEFRGEYLNLGGTWGGTKLVPKNSKFRGYPMRQYRCKVADEPSPCVPRHHPIRLKRHLHFGPRAAGCFVWVSLRAPCARTAGSRPG
jgi:hypothetical protein